jgi:HK97 family phage prohead protease
MPPTPVLLDAPDTRTGIARPIDRSGRHVFRGSIDTRAVETNEDGSIGFVGHAIVWNTRTWIGSKSWGFWEQIAPESVTKTLQEADIRFLQNHNPDLLLARNKSGTLRLTSDATGLAVDADMAPVTYAQDLAVLLERGDISQMSFAFEELGYKSELLDDGTRLYTVTEMRLFDVAVVTYPAYEETDAGLRSLAFEQLCRAAGISGADSRRLMRHFASGEPIDPEILSHLQRGVALEAGTPPEPPAEAERSESEPATTTRSEASPPAETTGDRSKSSELRRRTLATRTNLLEGTQ